MKRIIALICAVVLAVCCFAGCSQNEGKFVVGFDKAFPPMGFVDDNGNLVGFDLDLAAEVAKRLNMELVLQPIDWDSKDMELNSANISCILNGFTMARR